MRKGIVSYIFSMLLLFSATILANDFGVVESGGESLAQSTNMSLRFYNQIQTAGHIEFVARVIGDSDLLNVKFMKMEFIYEHYMVL